MSSWLVFGSKNYTRRSKKNSNNSLINENSENLKFCTENLNDSTKFHNSHFANVTMINYINSILTVINDFHFKTSKFVCFDSVTLYCQKVNLKPREKFKFQKVVNRVLFEIINDFSYHNNN